MKATYSLFSLLFLASCCPKDGIERNINLSSYTLAIDYYSQGQPVNVKTVPQDDTYVVLVDNQNFSEKQISIDYDASSTNRVIYKFNESWDEKKIRELNVRFGSFVYNQIQFTAIEKAKFERAPVPYEEYFHKPKLSFLNEIECIVHSIASVVLPQAHAMSCPASKSSKVTFRTGTLVRVNLD